MRIFNRFWWRAQAYLIGSLLRRWFGGRQAPAQVDSAAPAPRTMRISPEALARARGTTDGGEVANPFTLPRPAPGVAPKTVLAMDEDLSALYSYAAGDAFVEGQVFLGYPTLAAMAQRAEYRRPAEIYAEEMTRKWLKFKAVGDIDKSEQIKALEDEFDRIGAQRIFREAIQQDGIFGRAQIFIETTSADPDELSKPLSLTVQKIGIGSLKGLKVVEPIWTYPGQYNSTNPLAADFYKPTSWYVMSQEVHASRLITIISRQVPEILKPAYLFGGLSLVQMSKPYVDNWLRTRQSVSDLLHAFSTMVLATDMSQVLEGGASDDLFNRVDLFNRIRDNRGTMVIDKDSEVFSNVSAPISSLDHLQAQAQEHMSAVTGIPLVKLLGITPSGLNASSDGEIRVFYDAIAARQEGIEPDVRKLMQIAQLSLWGQIDPDITFDFLPLWELDEQALATIRKTDADTGKVLIDGGVIDPTEERTRVAQEEGSPYAGLDLNKVITPPDKQEGMPGMEGLGGLESAPGDEPEDGAEADVVPGAEPAAPAQPAAPAEPAVAAAPAAPKPPAPPKPPGPSSAERTPA